MNQAEIEALATGMAPAIRDAIEKAVQPLVARILAMESRKPEKGDPGNDGRDADMDQVRLWVTENVTRAVSEIPAPKDGVDGKDGDHGLGFEDMEEELLDDGRTIVHRYRRGDQVKEFSHKLQNPIYQGVYRSGREYEKCDRVTFSGSEWHCNQATSSKPGTDKSWTLCVKRGQDGKDGKDGKDLTGD